MLAETSFNPDVLNCLANLSNDEVFTPPQLANQMLDLLPETIWQDPKATFLDPACKTGVFLREAAKRLMTGLEIKIPDHQERVNHIFQNQLFGIAITELTGEMSRRTLYCSRLADGKYSVAQGLINVHGNIHYERVDHTWQKDRCILCGASQEEYDRGLEQENYAYQFIHTPETKEILDMRFDVIIGNPPYQLGSDGGTRDIPIYNKFVDQAKKLNPRYLTMIIPSRWMASGLGLSEFRRSMLQDRRISKLVDHPVASEVFSGVEVKGGVCYFLWERDYQGDCEVSTVRANEVVGPIRRNLAEHDIFVREGRALTILNKIRAHAEPSIIEKLSVDKEFGWTSNFDGFHDTKKTGDVPIYYIRKLKRSIGWISRHEVKKSQHLINTWKVMIPKAGSGGGEVPDYVLGQPFVAPNPSVCTQTYLFIYLDSKKAAESVESYLRSRFLRFLVSLRKITQDATRSTYTWVPQQPWDRVWTDAELYAKYKLSKEDISFIESRISPLEN